MQIIPIKKVHTVVKENETKDMNTIQMTQSIILSREEILCWTWLAWLELVSSTVEENENITQVN